MGFGNLINANILAEKKLKKVHPDEKKEKKDKFEERNVSAEPSKTVAAAKAPLVWLYEFSFQDFFFINFGHVLCFLLQNCITELV